MTGDGNRGALVYIELVRLAVVALFTTGGFAAGPTVGDLLGDGDPERATLLTSVLGALLGYIVGGVAGRSVVQRVEEAERRLQRVDAAVLITSLLGAGLASGAGLLLLWPVLLLPGRQYTVPAAMVVVVTLAYVGGRIGLSRAGDLLRFVGIRGRLQVTSPSRGVGTRLVDSSALVDGRLVEVARAGFLDGTLVVPRFVLGELQGLADSEDRRRRNAGRRGLDALRVLQDEGLVPVEVTDEDVPSVAEVDAKLAAICRERGAALVTVDANLARVVEISGVRVLNLHGLAEAMRPPVLPGERVHVDIVREGRERGQGIGYLPDGTMVVVERAANAVGSAVAADVTSIMQTRQGRMLFASCVEEAGVGHGKAGEPAEGDSGEGVV